MNFKNKIKSKLFQLLCVVLGLVITCGVALSCDTDDAQTVTNFNRLTFHDEFNTPGPLNPEIWGFEIGNGVEQGIPGWGNNELQYYTDRTENAVIELDETTQEGYLKINALQEDFEGFGYTSSRILTKGKFQQRYGRFEARIKLPWGQGLWPAFWILGDDSDGAVWPQLGEIDMMENRGQEPTIINGSIHGPGYSGGGAITKKYELENGRFDTDFHVFGVEWGPGYINYYVDDVLYNQITPETLEDEGIDRSQWVFDNDREFFIILNVAVGGNYPGNPDANTVFPQTMYVDYVRAYAAD